MSGPDGSTWDERRVVTAVFGDLVGSTARGERLDPKELKLVVGEAVARVVAMAEGFGGTIKDLAGDRVLALFGAPTGAPTSDDPERAVRSGLRIRDELDKYAREVEAGVGRDGVRRPGGGPYRHVFVSLSRDETLMAYPPVPIVASCDSTSRSATFRATS